jgi:PTS system mannose-specific IID component
MNFTRMEGLSYGWALAPMLKKIYANDPHRYLESLKRNSQFFNTNQHLAPFIMGLTLSMEKRTPPTRTLIPPVLTASKWP